MTKLKGKPIVNLEHPECDDYSKIVFDLLDAKSSMLGFRLRGFLRNEDFFFIFNKFRDLIK